MLNKVFEDFDTGVTRAGIDMTPIIDMVFILLIFFVVTTTFTKETGITVDKAQAASAQIIAKNLMVIALDKQGQAWYDKAPRSPQEIVALALKEQQLNPDINIVLVPDRQAQIDPLVTLMDKLRQQGINRFSLGTQQLKLSSTDN
jgi:biopolymer transport protein ExbD